jgi:hypothetical protein
MKTAASQRENLTIGSLLPETNWPYHPYSYKCPMSHIIGRLPLLSASTCLRCALRGRVAKTSVAKSVLCPMRVAFSSTGKFTAVSSASCAQCIGNRQNSLTG